MPATWVRLIALLLLGIVTVAGMRGRVSVPKRVCAAGEYGGSRCMATRSRKRLPGLRSGSLVRADSLRWREVDSNPRSLSLDSRGGEGAEVDQGGRERRRPFSRGDQRFESHFLRRREGIEVVHTHDLYT